MIVSGGAVVMMVFGGQVEPLLVAQNVTSARYTMSEAVSTTKSREIVG